MAWTRQIFEPISAELQGLNMSKIASNNQLTTSNLEYLRKYITKSDTSTPPKVEPRSCQAHSHSRISISFKKKKKQRKNHCGINNKPWKKWISGELRILSLRRWRPLYRRFPAGRSSSAGVRGNGTKSEIPSSFPITVFNAGTGWILLLLLRETSTNRVYWAQKTVSQSPHQLVLS